jgi:hypothetical protein
MKHSSSIFNMSAGVVIPFAVLHPQSLTVTIQKGHPDEVAFYIASLFM